MGFITNQVKKEETTGERGINKAPLSSPKNDFMEGVVTSDNKIACNKCKKILRVADKIYTDGSKMNFALCKECYIEQKKKEAKALFEAGKITEKGYKLLIHSLDNKAPQIEKEFIVMTNDEIVM